MHRLTARCRATPAFLEAVRRLRNIGISAHIDSGKTTTTERMLFYCGRIATMHEVKGSTEVGATMDSMELERERGITIRAAATQCRWGKALLNLIDTPGHVDFTVEVERALRVLDGAVLLLCGVGGVQSQTQTVDRQMRRYGVPRVAFVNKLDRDRADPRRVLHQVRERLRFPTSLLQLPIGSAQEFEGVVDVVEQRAVYFDGAHGERVRVDAIPPHLRADVAEAREALIATLADCDAALEAQFLADATPTTAELHDAIRRATVGNRFVPMLIGSAYRNKGVQLLLDAVVRYLPSPLERVNRAFEVGPGRARSPETNPSSSSFVSASASAIFPSSRAPRSAPATTPIPPTPTRPDAAEESAAGRAVELHTDDERPLVAFIFKLEETKKNGLCNYVRVYQGKLRREHLRNVRTGRTFVPPALVRMHADSAEVVDEVRAGDICAIRGEIEAASGDTLVRATPTPGAGAPLVSCESMFIPPRVLSAAVRLADPADANKLRERMQAFMREDPTFWHFRNPETGEEIVEGMGELHLEIYRERLKREHGLRIELGKPTVNYREVITERREFDYVFKRQSGGAGQWAHLKGYIAPLPIDLSIEKGAKNQITSSCPNGDIREALQKSVFKQLERKIFVQGELLQAPVWGVHFHLSGGAMHEVDSNDAAFRNATQELWERLLPSLKPTLVEPFMQVEMSVPTLNLTEVTNEFVRREGVVLETAVDGPEARVIGETALDMMFGFISDLRRLTKGRGDFSMSFKEYRAMSPYKAQSCMDARNKELGRKLYQLTGE